MTFWKKLVSCLMGVLLFAGAGNAAEEVTPPVISKILPKRTIALVMAENIATSAERFQNTAIAKLIGSDEVKAFLDSISGKTDMAYTQLTTLTGVSFDDVTNAFNGQVAFSFVGLKTDADFGDPIPELALFAEVTDYEAATKLMDKLVEALQMAKAPIKRWRFGLMDIGKIKDDDEPMELNYVLTSDSLLITFGYGSELFSTVMNNLENPDTETLSSKDSFTKAIEKAGNARDMFAYLDIAGLIGMALESAEILEEIDSDEREHVQGVLDAVGLRNIKWAHFAESIEDPGFKSSFHLGFDGKMEGIFKLYSQKPISEDFLNIVPEKMDMFAARINIDKLMGIVRKIMNAAEPESSSMMDMAMGMMPINLNSVIFQGLTGEAMLMMVEPTATTSAPQMGMGMPPMMMANFEQMKKMSIVIKIKSLEKFSAGYDFAIMMLQQQLSRGNTALDINSDIAPNPTYSINNPRAAAAVGVLPSFTIAGDYLVFAFNHEAITKVCKLITDGPESKMLDSADFLEIVERAEQEPGSVVSYTAKPDAEKISNALNNFKDSWAQTSQMLLNNRGTAPYRDYITAIDPSKLPAAEVIASYSINGYGTIVVKDDSISAVNYAPVGLSVITAAAPHATVILAMPYIMAQLGGPDTMVPGTGPALGDGEDIEF